MAEFAFDHVTNIRTEDRELVVAVALARELPAKLKRDHYCAAWPNEKPGGLHTCDIQARAVREVRAPSGLRSREAARAITGN